MKLAKIGAYLRQPTTLIALGLVLGTGVADWFGSLPEVTSIALLAAALPLLAVSDTSGILAKLSADRDGLAAIVHALTTHKDIGPAAIKVASDAVPGGALLAAAATALAQQQASASAPAKKASGIGSGAAGLLLLIGLAGGLSACAADPQAQLRQGVYVVDSAYHTLANPMPDVLAGKVPGITLTDDQKTLAKRASQTMLNEITALEKSAEDGSSLTQAALTALQTDFFSFETCWTGLKSGTTPDACTALAGSN
ncbi:hypothetical protein [Acetobacter senegalensis]|uniref:hypothetical protein n=1 Tax=Acetobacter senegalensis TaxID=446692 RepID=UPI001D04DBEE|nr:hypothetical protein [Acetobacter senegalensis]